MGARVASRWICWVLLGALAGAVAVAPASASAAPHVRAAAKSCGGVTLTPRAQGGVYDIRARGVGCRRARRVARASRHMSIGRGPYAYRRSGFRCRGHLVEQALPIVKW